MNLAPAHSAGAPPPSPNIKIKPQEERAPVVFSPAIRRVAHILYASKGAVLSSVIAENAAIEPNNVMSFISSVRTAVGPTGASVTVETLGGERAYRLTVPNRPAFERLVGQAPEGVIADHVTFRGVSGQKAIILRALVEAQGRYVTLGELMRAVYGRETTKARDKIGNMIRLMRQNLIGLNDPGAIVSRGTGSDVAYAWLEERDAKPSADAGPVKRLDGVTLPAIGCEAWHYYPPIGSRRSAHVVRLRGEALDRVFTDADRAAQPSMSALSAPHGVWPPARDEERDAA